LVEVIVSISPRSGGVPDRFNLGQHPLSAIRSLRQLQTLGTGYPPELDDLDALENKTGEKTLEGKVYCLPLTVAADAPAVAEHCLGRHLDLHL
jgi:hypothetical protein